MALIVGGLAVLAVVGIVLAFVAVDETTDLPPGDREARDVRISSCEVGRDTQWPHAGLTVTNRSSKTSDYEIGVEFVNASGTRVAEAVATVDNLAPDKVAQVTAQSLTQVDGPVTCNITDVVRFAS
ncbi:FxLYD domain-containing protein [Streptomyces sp. NPDC048604]|uniref:FxLYD domain-containing protein n=1 Tax=Streptomyces sp. NPDC048604 TaxID=3365578 RepID=UPI00371FB8FA